MGQNVSKLDKYDVCNYNPPTMIKCFARPIRIRIFNIPLNIIMLLRNFVSCLRFYMHLTLTFRMSLKIIWLTRKIFVGHI